MDELPDFDELTVHFKVKAHQGKLSGLEDRSDYYERMKLWCIPAFMDAHCYTILSTPDEKETWLRYAIWRQSGLKPDKPYFEAMEKKISIDSFHRLAEGLAEVNLNLFKVSPDQWLDAATTGIVFSLGDTHIDLTWMGSFNEEWKPLEKWCGKTETYFRRFFPEGH